MNKYEYLKKVKKMTNGIDVFCTRDCQHVSMTRPYDTRMYNYNK
jgi:hypothetical protein